MTRRYPDPLTVARLKRRARCPDCASRVTIHRAGPDIYHATVHHDHTCPWLKAHGEHGFTRITLVPHAWLAGDDRAN